MTFAAALLLATLARAPAGGAGETRDVRFEVNELSGAGASDLPVTLSALKGKRVILYFFPKADTPG